MFGANEAGKSTTLAAVGDLLFGFPKSTPYSFRYDAPLLRVGAVLEEGDTRLAVRRRKGNKDTLLDEADAPLPDATLDRMLHGLSAADFRLTCSLDHRRLREGGRAIVEASDDVGQALFAAGSGRMGVQALLRTLEAEADAVWTARARGRTYGVAERAHADAVARLKAAEVRPKAWSEASDRLETLAGEQAALEATRSARQAELKKLQRIRRLAERVQQRAALLAMLDGAPPSPLQAAHEALHAEAARAIAEAELQRRTAEAALLDAETKARAIAVDRDILARQDEIDALVSDAGAARKAASDLPGLQGELLILQADAGRLADELGLTSGQPERDALVTAPALPSRIVLDALQGLAAARRTLETRSEEAGEQLRHSELALDRAQALLAEQPSAATGQALAAACRDGQRAVAVEARLAERERGTARVSKALQAAWQRLLPWTGDADSLAALSPPPEDEIRATEAALQAALAELAERTRAMQAETHALERLRLEAGQLAATRRAVSAEEIAAIRATRTAWWEPVRAQVADGTHLADPAAALSLFESAIVAADRLADERFHTAEASAQLASLTGQITLAEQAERQAGERAARARQDHERAAQAWTARLAACGLPPMPPSALRQWASGRQDALQKTEDLAAAQALLTEDRTVVAHARSGLLAALESGDGAALLDAGFMRVLDTAQLRVDEAEAVATRRAALEARCKTALDGVADSRRRLDDLGGRVAAWQADWDISCRAAGLEDPGWTGMAARVLLFEQLRGRLEAIRTMRRRVADISRDQLAFHARALTLAAECHAVEPNLSEQALTEQLRVRLKDALAAARAADAFDASARRHRQDRVDAEQRGDAAHALLVPLMTLAGVDDATALAGAIEQASLARATRAELRQLEQAVLSAGDGHPLAHLVAEASQADPERLADQVSRLEADLAALDAEIAGKAQAVGQARQAFDALDRGPDAALAAADREQAAAAMAGEAEAYLVKRTQAVMLRWAVETYRERQQSPLLARAGTLFTALTGGSLRRPAHRPGRGTASSGRPDRRRHQPRRCGCHERRHRGPAVSRTTPGCVGTVAGLRRGAAIPGRRPVHQLRRPACPCRLPRSRRDCTPYAGFVFYPS